MGVDSLPAPVTEGERRLKKALDVAGLKYKMGVYVGPYEVDFLIYDIIIEVDGYSHLLPEKIKSDRKKNIYLEEMGYRLICVKSEETKDKAFLKKLIQSLDKPINLTDNEPITYKPFLPLMKLKDKLTPKEKLSAHDEMLEWLKKHSSEIPVCDGEEDE